MFSIRKIGIIGRTYRHLQRYRQILTVLFKYGFGNLVEVLKIEQYLEIGLNMISKKRRDRLEKLSKAERIRLALEELGPTFIKLGQILSTRPDLIPVDLIDELSKLQDMVPPCSFDEASNIIEMELGSPPEKIFDFIDKTPLASASIGQVYKARLKDGEEVVVKVQRPGIRKIIEVDLEIMFHLATLMERHIEEMALHRPVKVVEEFSRTIGREIDYNIEASNMERFAKEFLDDSTIYIPKVFREATTSRVITMEFVDGIKISEIDKLDKAGLDKKIIISRGANLYLRQVFEHGFFHADPHPGNIYVLPNNVICLLDYGMVGTVDRQTREDFVDLIDHVVHKDSAKATKALLKLTIYDEDPDMRMLERGVSEFMSLHLYKSLKDIEVGKILRGLLEMASRHCLRIPADIFLMMKVFSAIEGVGLRLNPDFDMIAQAAPFIEKVKTARFYPKRIAEDIIGLISTTFQFVQQFPKDALEITRLIKQQKLSIRFEHRGFEPVLETYNQISNRISFSIVIASLIIGSALIVFAKTPPLFHGLSIIGIIGFISAAIMGIWLLVAILRKGRL
ncbi:MAG: AarF/ABC1/UbiB kinase family protein [Candidatus Desulfaltia sp.]|nr:AarF/ABC1/UbiB kinase family protein [Candidatus Desulfaltia sp.]